jgi:hypothetical protein
MIHSIDIPQISHSYPMDFPKISIPRGFEAARPDPHQLGSLLQLPPRRRRRRKEPRSVTAEDADGHPILDAD